MSVIARARPRDRWTGPNLVPEELPDPVRNNFAALFLSFNKLFNSF